MDVVFDFIVRKMRFLHGEILLLRAGTDTFSRGTSRRAVAPIKTSTPISHPARSRRLHGTCSQGRFSRGGAWDALPARYERNTKGFASYH